MTTVTDVEPLVAPMPAAEATERPLAPDPVDSGTRLSVQAAEPDVRYLSDIITAVPLGQRRKFVNALKAAILRGEFDGGPLDDTFKMALEIRVKDGAQKRETDQREFVFETGVGFQRWYELQQRLLRKQSGHMTRLELETGRISLQDLAASFRNRGHGAKGKQKARAARPKSSERANERA